jgi:hypothetical protein
MKPYLRSLFPGVALPILVGVFGMSEVGWAQTQEKAAETPKTQTKPAPQKPKRDTGWVTTNDPVALLALRRESVAAEATAAEAAKVTPATATNATTEEIAKRNSQIAGLEKEIQGRQERIALLMRLFVNDERPFLNDPGHAAADAAAAERRKYEQDELLYEAAQIARLRGKVEELKTAGNT